MAWQDLKFSLDVGGASSLPDALASFCEWETLDGDNCWQCDVCGERVRHTWIEPTRPWAL